jgi:hypothetical protein
MSRHVTLWSGTVRRCTLGTAVQQLQRSEVAMRIWRVLHGGHDVIARVVAGDEPEARDVWRSYLYGFRVTDPGLRLQGPVRVILEEAGVPRRRRPSGAYSYEWRPHADHDGDPVRPRPER